MTTAQLIPTTSPVSGPTLLADLNLAFGSMRRLAADDGGGQNVATAQPWFPAFGAVTLSASGLYFFTGRLYVTRVAGATSHTTAALFGGSATINNINFWADARTGDSNALAARNGLRATTASGAVVKAASTSTTEDLDIYVEGVVDINGAGTFIPQFQYSAAPGGTPTIKTGTYFLIWPWGIHTDDRGGLTWS